MQNMKFNGISKVFGRQLAKVGWVSSFNRFSNKTFKRPRQTKS